jgi:protein-disulfide isomerase
MNKRIDPLTLFLVICAVLISALVIRRELVPQLAAASAANRMVPDWRQLSRSGYRLGASDGRVQIGEFSDFQCPYCADAHHVLADALARHPNDVTLIYRHFPLRAIHPRAVEAALAAECAGEQGRFGTYHDMLFAAGDSLGRIAWEEIARRAGVAALDEFSSCVHSRKYLARVERDERVARALGLRGTPTLVVNGEMIEGAVTSRGLEDAIARASRR